MRILTAQQEDLLKDERRTLGDLRVSLVSFGASREDQSALSESIQQLDEFFLLVVVGEFNAGKSAFINALLGESVLKEGVTPTTTQVNILRYGEEQTREMVNENLHQITAPVSILDELSIVDTPGTNAIIREHEEITSQFIPRSDLVLFITSADRPFTESERAFLESIRDWGKKVVVVMNKIDILQNEQDLSKIIDFISDNARAYLGIVPEIYPVSAKNAFRSKKGEEHLWGESRFESLEAYIQESLDESSRLKLKFLNPLGVGIHISERYQEISSERLNLLQDDFTMLDDIDRQLDIYREDMTRDFTFRMSDIENILFEMDQSGQDYFDETIRLGRVFDLLNKDRIQKGFEDQVVKDLPQQIDKKVGELIDWLVDSDLKQWQAVTEHISDRRRKHKDRIVGEAGAGSFHFDRERLIDGIGREAREVVESYDKVEEAASIAQGAQNAVAAAAAMEISAISLGALVTALATTVAADVTGILLASLIAALGLFVIPARRRQAKKEMRDKIAEMKDQLMDALNGHFSSEIERSIQHINTTIAPYTRFIRAEREKNTEIKEKLDEVINELRRLQTRVEDLA